MRDTELNEQYFRTITTGFQAFSTGIVGRA